MVKANFNTKQKITWCPGCPNFMILEAVKKALVNLKLRKEEVVLTTGIGCHGKIFDYVDIGGVYSLHGRPIPVAIGIKLGNPKLKVIAFAGDGDTYNEGLSHFIHAARYNSDITLVVHDNRAFSLTTGQATATSQEGFETKVEPKGEFLRPLNPILLALSSGASFVARANARDVQHTSKILEEAIKHRGFSYVEILQDCLIFNLDVNNLDNKMYRIDNREDIEKARELASEWDYNSKTRIPIGIFYQEKRETLEDEFKE
jgi:2-oxoglutarate ferredoxin oxidoreductase subunit beta